MLERLVDFLVARMIAGRVSGWNTKLGAAATILLATIGILSVLVESVHLAMEDHYGAALKNLNSEAMWYSLGGLGVTKQMLGTRLALDKLATGDLTKEVVSAELGETAQDKSPPRS